MTNPGKRVLEYHSSFLIRIFVIPIFKTSTDLATVVNFAKQSFPFAKINFHFKGNSCKFMY